MHLKRMRVKRSKIRKSCNHILRNYLQLFKKWFYRSYISTIYYHDLCGEIITCINYQVTNGPYIYQQAHQPIFDENQLLKLLTFLVKVQCTTWR